VIEGNYDDAVRLAAENSQKFGWVVVQDTAWEGYSDIPTKVARRRRLEGGWRDAGGRLEGGWREAGEGRVGRWMQGSQKFGWVVVTPLGRVIPSSCKGS
jgi:hypothetical protein